MSRALRHSALALHELGDEDRAWVLAQLPGDRRDAVAGQLEELRSLGVSRGAAGMAWREALGEAFVEVRTEASLEAPTDASGDGAITPVADTDSALLWHAAPSTISTLLAAEAPALVAMLMDRTAWPWSDSVLAGMDDARRQDLQARLDRGVPSAPALRAALSLELSAELARLLPAGEPALEAEAEAADRPPRRGRSGLISSMRRRTAAWLCRWRERRVVSGESRREEPHA